MTKKFLTACIVGLMTITISCDNQEQTEQHSDSNTEQTNTTTQKTPAPEKHASETHTSTAVKGDATLGKAVFLKASNMCTTCHKVDGVPEAVGVVGPALTGLGKTAATRKAGMSAESYIRESIEKPNDYVVEGFSPAMPPTLRQGMSDEEYENLVAYLLSL